MWNIEGLLAGLIFMGQGIGCSGWVIGRGGAPGYFETAEDWILLLGFIDLIIGFCLIGMSSIL